MLDFQSSTFSVILNEELLFSNCNKFLILLVWKCKQSNKFAHSFCCISFTNNWSSIMVSIKVEFQDKVWMTSFSLSILRWNISSNSIVNSFFVESSTTLTNWIKIFCWILCRIFSLALICCAINIFWFVKLSSFFLNVIKTSNRNISACWIVRHFLSIWSDWLLTIDLLFLFPDPISSTRTFISSEISWTLFR